METHTHTHTHTHKQTLDRLWAKSIDKRIILEATKEKSQSLRQHRQYFQPHKVAEGSARYFSLRHDEQPVRCPSRQLGGGGRHRERRGSLHKFSGFFFKWISHTHTHIDTHTHTHTHTHTLTHTHGDTHTHTHTHIHSHARVLLC